VTDSGNNLSLRLSVAAVVLIHLAILVWHGASHKKLAIPLNWWQTAFVGLVVCLFPVIGTSLLWTKYNRVAARLVAFSMFASLVFGVINHFVLISPDDITVVPVHPGHDSFVVSAKLLVVTETIGAVLATILLKHGGDDRGRRES
jgi:Na+(H+)/acetate symporter ActP